MYLLDRALKFEPDEVRLDTYSYLIEQGQVRYVNHSFEKWKNKKVCMEGTLLVSGRIMLATFLLECDSFTEFKHRQMELISRGCTTIGVAPSVQYERRLKEVYAETKHKLVNSMLDYVIGMTIPLNLLKPSFLRACKRLSIPFLRVHIESLDELRLLSWTDISQTLSDYKIVLIPIVKEGTRENTAILAWWAKSCAKHALNSALPVWDGEKWDKSLIQMVGLYPQKGVLHVGSDADYLLYPASRLHDNEDLQKPSIVFIKGVIIKESETITFLPGLGRQIKIKKPGRFMSIEHRRMTVED